MKKPKLTFKEKRKLKREKKEKIMVKPFKVNISDQIIRDIYDKVKKISLA